jgi:FdhD protein
MSKISESEVNILKVQSAGENQSVQDILAVEEPLEIRLVYGPAENRQTKSISITMRTPGNDFELATGFLFTEGIVNHYEEISKIYHSPSLLNPDNILLVELKENISPDIIKLERNFYTTSSCGVCGKASIDAVRTTGNLSRTNNEEPITVTKQLFYTLPDRLRLHQAIFETTGGLHASALFDLEGNLIVAKEDVGRHNALDKLIGYTLAQGILPLNKHILLLSGRASFELVQKAAMAQIKIIAAVGAPSSLAVEMAKDFGITLIGFLRDQRFNVYCGEDRIML